MTQPRSLRARQRWEQDPKICPSLLSRAGPSTADTLEPRNARFQHPNPGPNILIPTQGRVERDKPRPSSTKGHPGEKPTRPRGRGVKTETTEGFHGKPQRPCAV